MGRKKIKKVEVYNEDIDAATGCAGCLFWIIFAVGAYHTIQWLF